MKKQKNNKAITLIALVITVIVLLILVGVVFNVILGEDGLVERTIQGSFKNKWKSYQETAELYIRDKQIDNYLTSEKTTINVGTYAENADPNINIEDIIPNLSESDIDKVAIENDEFEYVPINPKDKDTQKEVKWCFEVNIKVKGYSTYEEFEEGVKEVIVSKGEFEEVNGVWCCAPDLTGFNYNQTYYVTYDDAGNEILGNTIKNDPPENWYDYSSASKKWANIVTIDDEKKAYFVWIPRYVYMIDEEAQNTETVKIKFVNKLNNYKGYKAGTSEIEVANYPDTTPTYDENGYQTNYCLPDSFKWDGEDLAGYWVSKYKVSYLGVTIDECKYNTNENSITIEKVKTSQISGSVAIASYDVYLDGELNQTVTSFPCTISGLKANTEYNIKIVAKDSDGYILGTHDNEMAKTTEAPINTLATPDLTGFNPDATYYVTYADDGTEDSSVPISQSAPDGWYDYTNKKWANIVTIDDEKKAYFVWIPRYEYRTRKSWQEIEVRFISKSQSEATGTYSLPESFKWDGQDIAGYWVSKYKVSYHDVTIDECKYNTNENSITIEKVKTSQITGSVAIKTYDVYLDGVLNQTVTSFPCTISGLEANTEYNIKIDAKDSTGYILGTHEDEMAKTTEAPINTLATPDLTGFNPDTTYYVTYADDGTEDSSVPISQSAPDGWYDYTNKKWANIVTKSGDKLAYFVWIPRYEYRTRSSWQEIEVRFIAKTQTGATGGYKLPDSFKWDGEDIAGYWVSKYKVSE